MRTHLVGLALTLTTMACGARSRTNVEPAPSAAPSVVPSAVSSVATPPVATVATPMASMSIGTGAAPPETPVKSQCEGVALELRNAHVTNGSLEVDVYLKNDGKKSYALMATGDGSCDGRRNPKLIFALTPNDAKPVGLCGMMNPIVDEDFLTLAPGAQRKLGWTYAPQPAHPGTYTLRATYTNDPAWPMRGKGSEPGSAMEARIRKTIPCEVTSAAITVRIP